MMIVEAPWPQPMSATCAPARSFASTPSRAGIHAWIRLPMIRRAEEPLDAMEERVIVLVPADALAGAERLGELVHDPAGGDRGLERADDEGRAVLLGERQRLLGRHRVAARFGRGS